MIDGFIKREKHFKTILLIFLLSPSFKASVLDAMAKNKVKIFIARSSIMKCYECEQKLL